MLSPGYIYLTGQRISPHNAAALINNNNNDKNDIINLSDHLDCDAIPGVNKREEFFYRYLKNVLQLQLNLYTYEDELINVHYMPFLKQLTLKKYEHDALSSYVVSVIHNVKRINILANKISLSANKEMVTLTSTMVQDIAKKNLPNLKVLTTNTIRFGYNIVSRQFTPNNIINHFSPKLLQLVCEILNAELIAYFPDMPSTTAATTTTTVDYLGERRRHSNIDDILHNYAICEFGIRNSVNLLDKHSRIGLNDVTCMSGLGRPNHEPFHLNNTNINLYVKILDQCPNLRQICVAMSQCFFIHKVGQLKMSNINKVDVMFCENPCQMCLESFTTVFGHVNKLKFNIDDTDDMADTKTLRYLLGQYSSQLISLKIFSEQANTNLNIHLWPNLSKLQKFFYVPNNSSSGLDLFDIMELVNRTPNIDVFKTLCRDTTSVNANANSNLLKEYIRQGWPKLLENEPSFIQ